MIVIEQLKEITPQTLEELTALSLELHVDKRVPTAEDAEKMLADMNTILMVVRNNGRIIGMATLFIIQKLGRRTSYLEDVVIESEHQGQGLGARLIAEVIAEAKRRGAKSISLTSGAKRIVAHRLYKSLGFTKRETDCFRLELI